MLKTNGVSKYIDYLNEQIYLYEEKKEHSNAEVNQANIEKLKYFYVLKKIFTMDLTNYYFENVNTIISSIMNNNLSVYIKLECVCYIFNVNRQFFDNSTNFEKYFEYSKCDLKKQAMLEFNKMSLYYNKLARIINSRNRINPIDKLEDEDIYFKKINFPKHVTDQIIDTALRNYELNVIYDSKKRKN